MTDDKTSPSTSALNVRPGVDIDRTRVVRPSHRRRALTVEDYVEGVAGGNRTILGRAFTLVESANAAHKEKALKVLQALAPRTGQSIRLGITGIPGVGKSTFIEALGMHLVERGHRVAVLAVDPSSGVSGGSILGDKTRMARLATDPRAFIRPSPSSGTLGGVTRTTRETMIVCEAAGFDVVLVETVGVGQSETVVAEMVDFFLVLMLPGAGDELQGIKKGVLEIADMIAINKADGESLGPARAAAREYESALHIMTPASPNWRPPVVLCSALTGEGLDALWAEIERHRAVLTESGELPERRREQQIRWMWSMLESRLLGALKTHPRVVAALPGIERNVAAGRLTPPLAVDRILELFGLPEAPGE